MLSTRACDFQGLKESKFVSCGWELGEEFFENWKVLNVADLKKNEQKTITVPGFLYNFLFSLSTLKVQGIHKISEYIVVVDKEICFAYSLEPFIIFLKLRCSDHLISSTGKKQMRNNTNKDESLFSERLEPPQTQIYEDFKKENDKLLNRYCVDENCIHHVPFFWSPENCKVFFLNKKTSNGETLFRGVNLFNERVDTFRKSSVDNYFDSYIDALCADYDSGFFYVYSLNSYLCSFVDKCTKKLIIIFLPVSACGYSRARQLGTYFNTYENYIKQFFAQIIDRPMALQHRECVKWRNLKNGAFYTYDKEGEKAPRKCIRLRKWECLNMPKISASKIPARIFNKSIKRDERKNILKNRERRKRTAAVRLLRKEDVVNFVIRKCSNLRSKSIYATNHVKDRSISEARQHFCFCMDQERVVEYGIGREREFAKEKEEQDDAYDTYVQKPFNCEHCKRVSCGDVEESEQANGGSKKYGRDGHSKNNESKQRNYSESNGNSESDNNGEMNDANGNGIGDNNSGSGSNNGGDDGDNDNSDRDSDDDTNDEDEDNEEEKNSENEEESEEEANVDEEEEESNGDDDNEKNTLEYNKGVTEEKNAKGKRKRKEKSRMEKKNKKRSLQESNNKEPAQMNGNVENGTITSRNTEYECVYLNNNSGSSVAYNSDNFTNISPNNQLTISNNNSVDASVSSFSDLNGSAKSSTTDTKETQDGLERIDMGEMKRESVSKGKKSLVLEKIEEEMKVKKMKTNENTDVTMKVEGKGASKEQGSTVEEDEEEYTSRKEALDQSDILNVAEQDTNRTTAFSEILKEENGYMLNEAKTNNDDSIKKEESSEDANLKKKIRKKSSKKKIEKHGKCFEDEKKEVLTKVSQVTRVGGVCFDKNRQRWIAHWKIDGKYHKHYFPINQYGFENARERAVNCRKQAEKQYNLPEIQPRNRCNQMRINTSPYVKRALKLPRCDGVGFDEMSQSWVSTYVVHKKFAVDDYGFYEARERAIFCRKTFEKVNSNADYKQLLTETIGTDEEEQKALNVLLNIDIGKIEEMLAERNVRTNGNKSNGDNNGSNRTSGSHSRGGGLKRNHSGGSESVTSVEQSKQNKGVSKKEGDENSEMLSDRNEHLKVTQEAIEMILKNIKHKTLPEIKMKLEDKQKFENYDTLLDKHFKFITSAKTVGQLRPYISLFHSFIVCHTLPQNMPFKEQLFIVEALDCSSFFAEATK